MKALKLDDPFRSAIQWIFEDVYIGYIDLGCWVPEPWDTRGGRGTLAGVAAHFMPPHCGQDLHDALQDACTLVQTGKCCIW